MGQVVDWSSSYAHYPHGASLAALALSQRDPRAYWNYLNLVNRANAAELATRTSRGAVAAAPRGAKSAQVDWSVELGAEGTAATQYPAKFSFNVNAAPDCTNDYVVFTIDNAPNAGQANIAAFNNLYSGANLGGNPPLCPGGGPNTYWGYRVSNVRIETSPAISLDGTKVAFVDDANPAVFHVLTWTANQGTVTAPVTPSGAEIVDVTLTGATTDPSSSVFMDYYNDVAYVAANPGNLYKITGVFRGVPTLAGGVWPITGLGATPTSPVIDFSTGNIFLGNAAGQIFGFTPAGTALANSGTTIGNGTVHGGITDPPVIDSLHGLLYLTTGGSAGGTALVGQFSTTDLSTLATAAVGRNNTTTLHAPTFNAAYFSGNANTPGAATEYFLYVCGVAVTPGRTPVLYRVGFTGSPGTMNSSVDASTVSLSANNGEQCSPLTEFANPPVNQAGEVDRLFFGLLTSAFVEDYDISTNTTPTFIARVSEAGGTSAIIIDNVSTAVQASSIYFSTLSASAACATAGTNHRCAVKLTQSGLQ